MIEQLETEVLHGKIPWTEPLDLFREEALERGFERACKGDPLPLTQYGATPFECFLVQYFLGRAQEIDYTVGEGLLRLIPDELMALAMQIREHNPATANSGSRVFLDIPKAFIPFAEFFKRSAIELTDEELQAYRADEEEEFAKAVMQNFRRVYLPEFEEGAAFIETGAIPVSPVTALSPLPRAFKFALSVIHNTGWEDIGQPTYNQIVALFPLRVQQAILCDLSFALAMLRAVPEYNSFDKYLNDRTFKIAQHLMDLMMVEEFAHSIKFYFTLLDNLLKGTKTP